MADSWPSLFYRFRSGVQKTPAIMQQTMIVG
jgi:hypothetical protein